MKAEEKEFSAKTQLKKNPQRYRMKILILTPIQLEHEAIVAQLSDPTEEIAGGNRYVKGFFQGKHHVFEVFTQQTGSGNSVAALATERAVKRFNPAAVLLVGVAGGVKDVDIGDVVVATKFYDYEYSHESDEGTKARPLSGFFSKHLKALAESVSARQEWWKRLPAGQLPNVVFGPIASGQKVIAGKDTQLFQFLKNNYNDTVAVEMEAAGVGGTMGDYPSIPSLNIRGISDLIDGKSQAEAAGSQRLAAAHAAAFAFELIYHLDTAYFSPLEMEVRNRLDDFMELLKKVQAPAQPHRKDDDYPTPPNRAPLELERLQPLSKDDRLYIADLLEQHGESDKGQRILVKLDSLYDFQQLGLEALRRPAIERYEALEKARVNKQQVVLQQYRSNSNDIRDRRVEPFKIDADLDTLQAFDVGIGQNRHFRLSRIKRVLPTDEPWQFEDRHVRKETDDFRIADNDMVNVQLRLDVLAYNLLTEAYPNTKRNLLEGAEPNTWDYEGKVNRQFYGLINFIMGNAGHVEIIGPESLKERMREEAERILRKLGK